MTTTTLHNEYIYKSTLSARFMLRSR